MGRDIATMRPDEVAEAALAEPLVEDPECPRIVTCRGCLRAFHIEVDLEPAPFCEGCVWVALEILAKSMQQLARMEARREAHGIITRPRRGRGKR